MDNKRRSPRQFSLLYLKDNLVLALVIVLPVSVLFFVVALVADVLSYDLIIPLVPIVLAAVFLGLVYVKTLGFESMIGAQEKLLNVCFDSDGLIPLYPRTLYFSSESWFVKAGCWAIHRSYLAKITVRVVNEKSAARSYVVEFRTVDGKRFVDRNIHSEEIKRIRKWHENEP